MRTVLALNLATAADQAAISPVWAMLALALLMAREAVTRWAPSG